MSFAFSWTHVDSLDFFVTVFRVDVVLLQFKSSTFSLFCFWVCLERFCKSLEHFGVLLN